MHMTAEASKAWNEWANTMIARRKPYVDEAVKILGRECGRYERELRAEYDGRINELSAIVAALRVEIEALRPKKKSKHVLPQC